MTIRDREGTIERAQLRTVEAILTTPQQLLQEGGYRRDFYTDQISGASSFMTDDGDVRPSCRSFSDLNQKVRGGGPAIAALFSIYKQRVGYTPDTISQEQTTVAREIARDNTVELVSMINGMITYNLSLAPQLRQYMISFQERLCTNLCALEGEQDAYPAAVAIYTAALCELRASLKAYGHYSNESLEHNSAASMEEIGLSEGVPFTEVAIDSIVDRLIHISRGDSVAASTQRSETANDWMYSLELSVYMNAISTSFLRDPIVSSDRRILERLQQKDLESYALWKKQIDAADFTNKGTEIWMESYAQDVRNQRHDAFEGEWQQRKFSLSARSDHGQESVEEILVEDEHATIKSPSKKNWNFGRIVSLLMPIIMGATITGSLYLRHIWDVEAAAITAFTCDPKASTIDIGMYNNPISILRTPVRVDERNSTYNEFAEYVVFDKSRTQSVSVIDFNKDQQYTRGIDEITYGDVSRIYRQGGFYFYSHMFLWSERNRFIHHVAQGSCDDFAYGGHTTVIEPRLNRSLLYENTFDSEINVRRISTDGLTTQTFTQEGIILGDSLQKMQFGRNAIIVTHGD